MTEEVSTEEKVANAVNWIESLCDNDFRQRSGYMGTYNRSMCCLGVARHILRTGGKDVYEPDDVSFDYDSELEPVLGLRVRAMETLMCYNDDGGYTHPQIGWLLANKPQDFFEQDVAKELLKEFEVGC